MVYFMMYMAIQKLIGFCFDPIEFIVEKNFEKSLVIDPC